MRHRPVLANLLARSIVAIAVAVAGLSCATNRPSETPVQAAVPQVAPSAPAVGVAGAGGKRAVSAVFRVVCTAPHTFGTGFLHRSGRIITAAHVVSGCERDNLVITGAGQRSRVAAVQLDERTDLALLTPEPKLSGTPLPISGRDAFPIGLQVTTWGYPQGYLGTRPLLSVGYFSGAQLQRSDAGLVQRWVLNAAFNSGNSGGPLIDLEDGAVMGVVCSKLAPMPRRIEAALEALKQQRSGPAYRARRPDGTIVELSEGEVVAEVLEYLRRQTQLVIGYAVTSGDLRTFLEANGVQP